MNKPEIREEIDSDGEFETLKILHASAPGNVLPRVKKRVRTAQLGKDLIERQAMGFWAVIDAFLRLLFVPKTKHQEEIDPGEK